MENMTYEKPTAILQKTAINTNEEAYSAAAAPIGVAVITAGAVIGAAVYTKHCW
jgi:hypothetical protein